MGILVFQSLLLRRAVLFSLSLWKKSLTPWCVALRCWKGVRTYPGSTSLHLLMSWTAVHGARSLPLAYSSRPADGVKVICIWNNRPCNNALETLRSHTHRLFYVCRDDENEFSRFFFSLYYSFSIFSCSGSSGGLIRLSLLRQKCFVGQKRPARVLTTTRSSTWPLKTKLLPR